MENSFLKLSSLGKLSRNAKVAPPSFEDATELKNLQICKSRADRKVTKSLALNIGRHLTNTDFALHQRSLTNAIPYE